MRFYGRPFVSLYRELSGLMPGLSGGFGM